MKRRIAMTIIPTFLGIISVFVVLLLINMALQKQVDIDLSRKGDVLFFKYLLPGATLAALLIQFFLTISFWERFKRSKRVWGLTIIQFTTLLCSTSGLIFGLVFWENAYGITELIFVTTTGLIAFSIYWAINILVLRQIDKKGLPINR